MSNDVPCASLSHSPGVIAQVIKSLMISPRRAWRLPAWPLLHTPPPPLHGTGHFTHPILFFSPWEQQNTAHLSAPSSPSSPLLSPFPSQHSVSWISVVTLATLFYSEMLGWVKGRGKGRGGEGIASGLEVGDGGLGAGRRDRDLFRRAVPCLCRVSA